MSAYNEGVAKSRYKDEKSFRKALADGEKHRVILLYGSEAYLIEKWAKQLMGKSTDSTFDTVRIDGKNPDIGALWGALEALPLLAGEKRVLLDSLDVGKLNAQDLQSLCELLSDIAPSSTLVITAKTDALAQSAAGKKLIKQVEQSGAALELSIRGQGDLVKFLQAGAKKLGCELSGQTARYMLSICPADMLHLENEFRKVCAFAGGGQITQEQIDELVTPKIEARAFDLQKFILAGDAPRALGLLSKLFFLREDPIAILGALSMSFCDLYRARCARDAGQNISYMMKNFGYKSEFRASKAFENSSRLSTRAARRAVNLLCESDREMKSTGTDNKIHLEQLTIRLISVCGRVR